MSLGQALSTAMAGLRATQASLAVVSSNVANAETAGYVRRTSLQVEQTAGNTATSVRFDGINRELDLYVQTQLRTETSGASYADMRSQFYQQLQGVFGTPGAAGSLDVSYNNLVAALQSLSTSPESSSTRIGAVSAAQSFAQQLNSMSGSIQSLRHSAEQGIADACNTANNAMSAIADINRQLLGAPANSATTAALLDQRDKYLDQLSQIMDIKVVVGDNNQITVNTNSGAQLVGTQASKLSFDMQDNINARSTWDADPTKRTVGTITLNAPYGGNIDLIATHAIRSGQLAAYVDMRDNVLVKAQAQLDQIAAAMSSSLSDYTTAGSAVSAGVQSGFDVDIGALQNGNTIKVSYTDTVSGQAKTLTIMRVDDKNALPLPDTATADPNDKVIGVSFADGMSSVVADITKALGASRLQFSNPSGTTLRVLDDGNAHTVAVTGLSTVTTATSATEGRPEFALFTDASMPYTGAFAGSGAQSVGLSGRLNVNPAIAGDPSRLVVMSTSPLTASGDATRPNFILGQLKNTSQLFSASGGIGSTATPYSGTIGNYIAQVLSVQGEAANAAQQLSEGQSVVVNALKQRMSETSSVNIDEEMSNLLSLQNAYAANARVMSVIKDMYQALMNT